MNLKLAYGREGLKISLPDNLNVTIVQPKYVEGLRNQFQAVGSALCRPIAAKPLRDLVKSSDRVGIVFSDITRPVPYHIILPVLLGELNCVPDDQIEFFNATGTHRPNTTAELQRMLGSEIVGKYRIKQNDARDKDSHTLIGTTGSGNDIWIHSHYIKCDIRILTGVIEPHFFAGFSGGGKACMPGLALLETVLKNHCTANVDHTMANWGLTNGNPVWEEIQEAASMVPPAFLLNVALNRDKQITGVFAGDFEEAHRQGCIFVKENAMAPVKEPFDIVITSNSGYPLDLNLYQSVKGMSAASQVVREGGSIVVAAECRDGIPEHSEFEKLLSEAKSPGDLLRNIRAQDSPRQDMWQAQIQALVCQKADVYFYSRNLSDEQIEAALLKPCHSIENTIEQLLQKYGSQASICVLPEGPQTIPYLEEYDSEVEI